MSSKKKIDEKMTIAICILLFKVYLKIKIPIVLYYIEGYSVDEVKEILDIPQGTVKSRLSRGRRLLKTKLENTEVII